MIALLLTYKSRSFSSFNLNRLCWCRYAIVLQKQLDSLYDAAEQSDRRCTEALHKVTLFSAPCFFLPLVLLLKLHSPSLLLQASNLRDILAKVTMERDKARESARANEEKYDLSLLDVKNLKLKIDFQDERLAFLEEVDRNRQILANTSIIQFMICFRFSKRQSSTSGNQLTALMNS